MAGAGGGRGLRPAASASAVSDLDLELRVAPLRGLGQDRAAAWAAGRVTVLALADGAGGISGGAQAADRFLVEILAATRDEPPRSAAACQALLFRVDRALAADPAAGEAAGVLVVVGRQAVIGASVGDSVADLTRRQVRKPLLGSGEASAVPFRARFERGALVVMSDGLWRYARRERIAACCRVGADRLVALTREEQPQADDAAVILARRPG